MGEEGREVKQDDDSVSEGDGEEGRTDGVVCCTFPPVELLYTVFREEAE